MTQKGERREGARNGVREKDRASDSAKPRIVGEQERNIWYTTHTTLCMH